MKTTSILFIASFLFFLTTNINAELYMWVDENGVKHYSDTGPDEDAIFEERGEYELDKSEPGKNNIKARAEILKEQRVESAKKRKELYEKKIKKTNQRLKEIEASREKLKQLWQALYGDLKGNFESGYRIASKNFEGNIIGLNDGSIWSVVGDFPWVRTALWLVYDNIKINKIDGVMVNTKRNRDIWVKVRPFRTIKYNIRIK